MRTNYRVHGICHPPTFALSIFGKIHSPLPPKNIFKYIYKSFSLKLKQYNFFTFRMLTLKNTLLIFLCLCFVMFQ